MENLQDTFDIFADYLDARFRKGIHTTEDSIRYTFFYSLQIKQNIELDEIILESPHPVIDNAELDMHIVSRDASNDLIFEFKFHRKIPSGMSQPRPMHAGKLIADLVRLAKCKEKYDKTRVFLVYVTDSEMVNYLQKNLNRLSDFFDLSTGNILTIDKTYIENHSDTFIKEALRYGEYSFKVLSLYRKDFDDMFLRVYEIVE